MSTEMLMMTIDFNPRFWCPTCSGSLEYKLTACGLNDNLSLALSEIIFDSVSGYLLHDTKVIQRKKYNTRQNVGS
jgi:hypothetical protein